MDRTETSKNGTERNKNRTEQSRAEQNINTKQHEPLTSLLTTEHVLYLLHTRFAEAAAAMLVRAYGAAGWLGPGKTPHPLFKP